MIQLGRLGNAEVGQQHQCSTVHKVPHRKTGIRAPASRTWNTFRIETGTFQTFLETYSAVRITNKNDCLVFRGHFRRRGQIDRADQDREDSSHAAAASALSITINSLSWRLRPDAERFAAPVRNGDRARFLNRPAMAFGELYEFLKVVLSFAQPKETDRSREAQI